MKLLDCIPSTLLTVLAFYCSVFVKSSAGTHNTGTYNELFSLLSILFLAIGQTSSSCLLKSTSDCFISVFYNIHPTALLMLDAHLRAIKTRLHPICTFSMVYNLYNIYLTMIRFSLREIRFIPQLTRSNEAMQEYHPTICLSCFILKCTKVTVKINHFLYYTCKYRNSKLGRRAVWCVCLGLVFSPEQIPLGSIVPSAASV